MKRGIIIFTRIPKAGETKTRMMPYLTPEECCELHCCMLKDLAMRLKKTKDEVYIFYTPGPSCEQLEAIFGPQATYMEQRGDGLGERMYRAIDAVLGQGCERCVLMGTDIPEITLETIEQAFNILENKDIVFHPTKDGGYYLVGMKRAIPEAFEVKGYGGATVMEQTLKVLKEKGFTVGLGRQLCDLDEKEDLIAFARRARRESALRSTHTGRFALKKAKISIVIPIYNEKATINRLQEQLEPLKDQCEILFVDGGSTDGTLEMIRPRFRLLQGAKGRANQMNYGASHSSGDILFFLHCDSKLPDDPLVEIYDVMQKYPVGCFGVGFPSKNFFMLTNRVISNHRAKCRRIIFGDQGMFIERDLFFELGMFPALPIMEDYQFCLTMRKVIKKVGMTRHRIYTSDRRYPKGTIAKLRVMWQMFSLRKRYRGGESIQVIAREYKDIR